MKPSDAADLVARLVGAYPTREISVTTRRLYTESLLRFDLFDGQLAVAEVIENRKFPPTVAELLVSAQVAKRDRLSLELREAERRQLPAEVPCTVAEFLAANPDMRERARKLGMWTRTLHELEGV